MTIHSHTSLLLQRQVHHPNDIKDIHHSIAGYVIRRQILVTLLEAVVHHRHDVKHIHRAVLVNVALGCCLRADG